MIERQMIHEILDNLTFVLADLQMRREQAEEWYPFDPLPIYIKALETVLEKELKKFARLSEAYPQHNWDD